MHFELLLIICFMILFIIGFPIYMSGCNKKIGGGCSTTYDIVPAKVIGGCHQIHTITYRNDEYNDNGLEPIPIPYTYGDCRVKMSYKNNKKCYLFRSDDDHCNNYITDIYDYNNCNRLNNHSYPIGSEHTIYVNKQNDICYSHHYVSVLSKIGLSFIIISFVCLLCSIISFPIQLKLEEDEKTKRKIFYEKLRNDINYNPIIPHKDDENDFAQIL